METFLQFEVKESRSRLVLRADGRWGGKPADDVCLVWLQAQLGRVVEGKALCYRVDPVWFILFFHTGGLTLNGYINQWTPVGDYEHRWLRVRFSYGEVGLPLKPERLLELAECYEDPTEIISFLVRKQRPVRKGVLACVAESVPSSYFTVRESYSAVALAQAELVKNCKLQELFLGFSPDFGQPVFFSYTKEFGLSKLESQPQGGTWLHKI